MHESMLLHVCAAWRGEPPTIGFAQDATSTVVLRRALSKWGANWQSKFNGLSADMARRFAARNFRANDNAMRAAFKAAGFTVAFKPTKASVEAYQAVAAENIALIKSIPQQYLKDVQESVFQSVMRGGDLRSLAADIREKYGKSYKRAAFIARDQNAKAKAVIENVRRQQLDLDEAIWMHSSAGKVPRPTHVAMNGKRYKLADGMYDSAIGKYVWPGTEPNCRCTSRSIIPGFVD
jgi:SPP1 gp7 family putative phage head morphogenesis protein